MRDPDVDFFFGEAARFGFSSAHPATTYDSHSTCNNQIDLFAHLLKSSTSTVEMGNVR
jgi:hypothetical protein